jgi:hypothetical protein
MAAFRFGQITASNAICGPPCQLRLANSTALAQGPEQDADPARKVLLVVFRKGIKQSVDLKTHVSKPECSVAPDTSAIRWVLASVASPAGNCFAVANRGEKLKSGHGFPLNMLWIRLSE